MVATPTPTVVTGNIADVAPSAIVILAGTVAMDGALLSRFTTTPPVGAANGSVTVRLIAIPCIWLKDAGLMANGGTVTLRMEGLETRKLPVLKGSGWATVTLLLPAANSGKVVLRLVALP